MGGRRGFVLMPPCFTFVLTLLVTSLHYGDATVNRRVGIKLLSYANVHGQLPGGGCCDGQTLPAGGGCVPDSCDTAFYFCLRHHSNGSSCDPSLKTTALWDDNTVTQFGRKINDSDITSTSTLVIMPVSTMEAILVELDVLEVDRPVGVTRGTIMGNFSVIVNTTHIFTPHPDWDTYHFDNGVVRVSLNVTSFCTQRFYGANCDIHCMPLDSHLGHYDCDDNGNKVCKGGYEGNDCTDVIDLCVSSPCANGATCSPIVNDFTCTCVAGYTGKLCDVLIPTSPPPTPSPTSLPPTTTPTTPTTTTVSTTIASTTKPITTTTTTTTITTQTTTTASTTTRGPSPSRSPSTATTTPSFRHPPTTTTQTTTTATTTARRPSTSGSPSTATTTPSFRRPPTTTKTATTATSSPAAQRSPVATQTPGMNVGVVLGPLAAAVCLSATAVAVYRFIRRRRGSTVHAEEKLQNKQSDVEDQGTEEKQEKDDDQPHVRSCSGPASEAIPPLHPSLVDW